MQIVKACTAREPRDGHSLGALPQEGYCHAFLPGPELPGGRSGTQKRPRQSVHPARPGTGAEVGPPPAWGRRSGVQVAVLRYLWFPHLLFSTTEMIPLPISEAATCL